MAAMPRLHPTGGGLRILIVSEGDDRAVGAASDYEGVAVLRVSSLLEAQGAMATEHVDAILIDFELARTCDVRRQLATSSLRLPVIVLLDDDAVVEVSDAIAIGADGFYYKRQLYPWLFGGQKEPPHG